MSDVHLAVARLSRLPEVPEAVDAAREACTALRWHPALRRRIPEASAESRVRGATASAALDGAQMSVTIVRDVFRGARRWPDAPDPVERTVAAALRATAEVERVRSLATSAPRQALARLHIAAMADLLAADQVGRPRTAGEDSREMLELGPAPDAREASERLDQVCRLLQDSADLPAVVVAAVVHAELVAARPFVHGNAIVARAFERALVWGAGLDPTGVAVPEQAHHSMESDYHGALGAYASGDPQGVRLWILHEAAALTRAAGAGHDICDAVLAGRLTSSSSGSVAELR